MGVKSPPLPQGEGWGEGENPTLANYISPNPGDNAT